MEEFFAKISISILIRLGKEFGQYSFNQLTQNKKFFEVLNDFGLTAPKDDFNNLYFHALIRFTDYVSNKLFIEVFKNKEAISSFKKSQQTNGKEFERTLNQILLTDPEICKIPELKQFSVVPQQDIDQFLKIYKGLLLDIKSPLELEKTNKLNEIQKSIDNINKSLIDVGEISIILQQLINDTKELLFIKLNFSTLGVLNKLESYLENTTLPKRTKDNYLSQVLFLQGWCLFMLNNPDNQKKFIKAYEHNNLNIGYMEWAAISYYKLGMMQKAKELSLEILKNDSLNPKAYSVIKIIEDSTKVPDIVIANYLYKANFAMLFLRKKNNIKSLYTIFASDFQNCLPLQKIENLEDFLYKNLLINIYFENFINFYLVNFHFSAYQKIANSDEIEICIKSFAILSDFFGSSSNLNNTYLFANTNWVYRYCLYLKHQNSQTSQDLYNAFIILPDKNPTWYENTMSALSQTKCFDMVIDLTTKFNVPRKDLNIGIAFAIILTNGNKEKCKELIIEFVESILEINESILYNLTLAIELYNRVGGNVVGFSDSYLAHKKFSDEKIKKVLTLYCLTLNKTSIDDNREYLIELTNNNTIQNDSYKIILACLLTNLQEYKISNEIISSINGFNKHPLTLKIYIDNLISINEKSEYLLTLLEQFRSYFIDPVFLSIEIELYNKVSDYKTVYILSDLGNIHFPNHNYFIYYKIISLYYLGDEKLLEHLSETLATNFTFAWKSAFFLANICSEKGKNDLAIQIAYKSTKENFESPIVRDAYFSFYLFNSKNKAVTSFNEVNLDCSVKFKINNQIKVKHFTDDLIRKDLYKEFLNRSIGNFTISQGLGKEPVVIQIIEITDKYRGLFLEIMEEVQKDPYSGSEIISIDVPSGDIEEFNKKMVEQFGEKEGINKRLRSEQIEAYKLNKISFTELVKRVSNDQIFDTYYSLRNQENIFIVPPINIFCNIQICNEPKFVLDIPSVILLNDLNEDLGILVTEKFTISHYTKEYFRLLLKEEEAEIKSNILLDISETSVRPVFYHQSQRQIRINKIKRINKWIEDNCIIGFAKNKLEVLNKLKENREDSNGFYWEYYIDTIFLANQEEYYLISDDFFFYKMVNGKVVLLSTEYYLRSRYPADKEIVSKLIEYNFIGLNITSDQLKYEYEKSPILESPKNTFIKSIRSLDYIYTQTKNNYDEAIGFLKYLYSLSMDIKIKKRISRSVLQSVFRNYPFDIKDLNTLQEKIKTSFNLLGKNDLEVLDDLTFVLRIINLIKK